MEKSSFVSQHTTSVPEDLTLLTFVGTCTYMVHINSYRHIHMNETKSFLTLVLIPLKELCCECLEDDRKSG